MKAEDQKSLKSNIFNPNILLKKKVVSLFEFFLKGHYFVSVSEVRKNLTRIC